MRVRHGEKFHVHESAGSSCWRYRHHESAVNSRQRGPAPKFNRGDQYPGRGTPPFSPKSDITSRAPINCSRVALI
ncbi:MAG TPA: hypothetical protein DIC56_08465 [Rhizobium sp.]|nr:hypothetical protein [Rhizobium sp.]